MHQLSKVSRIINIFLCRHVYNYCTNVNQNSASRNEGRTGVLSKNKKTQMSGGAQLVGLELYKRLRDFLRKYLVKLLEVSYYTLN